MKRLLIISASIVLAFALYTQAGPLVSTDFDSSEGWTEGGVTVSPNPAVGSWYSYSESVGGDNPAKVDLSGNGMDYEALPESGDGLLMSDRAGGTNIKDAVVGWPETTKSIIEFNVDMQVYKGSGSMGSIILKNTPYNGSTGVSNWIGGVMVTGSNGNIAYRDSGAWVTPEAGKFFFYPSGGVQAWGHLKIVADTSDEVYSVYGIKSGETEEATIIENIPFQHAAGDASVNSAQFYLGNSYSRAYWDNLEITAVPEPATLGLLALGSFAVIRKRK
jgi:hypothetical protein